jgi:hypothetical protein
LNVYYDVFGVVVKLQMLLMRSTQKVVDITNSFATRRSTKSDNNNIIYFKIIQSNQFYVRCLKDESVSENAILGLGQNPTQDLSNRSRVCDQHPYCCANL